jgi:very-short-patch-repair endonuclease
VGVIVSKKFTAAARKLRKNSTEAENLLWQKLRNRQLEGFKFRRQQPVGSYILDFVNFEKRIVIEVDGGQHAVLKDKDKKRDDWLKAEGFEVMRFWNNEVFENLDGILQIVRNKLITPSPIPSHQGRGNRSES